jgi:lysylphosphatidylglycerol synthetase-like protein (DUF2156 family)
VILKVKSRLINPTIRAKHREHIMAICQLTYKALKSKLSVDTDRRMPAADLLVFPDVALN